MKKQILILTMSLISFAIGAQKFGYVDTQLIITELPEVKQANSSIETYKAQFQKKGQEMVKSLQAKYAGLEQKQKNGEISRIQLETEAKTLQAEEQKIAQFEQESQQKIVRKSEDLLAPIRTKVQDAIDAVAQEMGFDYVFDSSIGIILYGDEESNLNDEVKAKLGM